MAHNNQISLPAKRAGCDANRVCRRHAKYGRYVTSPEQE
jgi:hypothetical protein